MSESITIQKNLALEPGFDYYALRREGLDLITKLGSRYWTDYNTHDPGITILEGLCYIITELCHRSSFDVKDLLAEQFDSATVEKNKFDPYLQAFFTAREILTVNPWTITDFRKSLADITGIKNAWLFCKHCPCESNIFINCKEGRLTFKEPLSNSKIDNFVVIPKGLYDVLLEFDEDRSAGDLNSGKIKHRFNYKDGNNLETLFLEIRFPSWKQLADMKSKQDQIKKFRDPSSKITKVTAKVISGNKEDNIDIEDKYLAKALRKPMFVTLRIEYKQAPSPSTKVITFDDIPFSLILLNDAVRKKLTVEDLRVVFEDSTASGPVAKYLDRIKLADDAIKNVNTKLHTYRNLAEDYCSVQAVEVEEISVCADLEVEPYVDIEQVLAEIFYQIEEYFSPEVRFYSMQELFDKNFTSEEIFDGPKLDHGFIITDEFEKTGLKKVLYTSDIINLIMDIPGVISIKNLTLVKYDNEGNRIQSEAWSMDVTENHQPRFYIEGSKFLVFKNGLPFLPDMLELSDTMDVIRGRNSRPKLKNHELDIPVPFGKFYDWEAYFPLQYSFPLTYGIGFEGLPSNSTDLRIAQAKQLKAYLLIFEYFCVNYLSQIANLKELFSLSTDVIHTYFTRLIPESDISGVTDLYNALTQNILNKILESGEEFLNRRNRFLDHLLGRFAEQFIDYTLMLYSYIDQKEIADKQLISSKIAFLKNYAFISSNRARSFNYKEVEKSCDDIKKTGLHIKLEALLGANEYLNYFDIKMVEVGGTFKGSFKLNIYDTITLVSTADLVAATKDELYAVILNEIKNLIAFLKIEDRYLTGLNPDNTTFLKVIDSIGNIISGSDKSYTSESEAKNVAEIILDFTLNYLDYENFTIIEHILLRPMYLQDNPNKDDKALLNICVDCENLECSDSDPYSYRLTFVFNAETGISENDVNFRKYAENTIRTEVPAHLFTKICWVSKEQYIIFSQLYCDWLKELKKDNKEDIDMNKLISLVKVFNELKNIYPPASLHDCIDGNDENRTFLNQSVV